MGTNYYADVDTCQHCDRPGKTIHIGKSSWGWTFSFRGYRNQHPEWSSGDEPGKDILSYFDWLVFLGRTDVIIKDEYGEIITLEQFMELVKSKRNAEKNHAKYILEDQSVSPILGYNTAEVKEREWVDDEGHSFSDVEFS